MKKYLKTVAGIMALTSVSMSLQAAVSAVISSADISNAEGLQIDSQRHEATSEIDGLNKNAVASNSQRRFDDARFQFEQVLLLLKQNYSQDHPYVQQAIRNLTDLDAKRESNVEKDRMYDELLRELSSRLPRHKGVTADNTPPLPEQRIMHF